MWETLTAIFTALADRESFFRGRPWWQQALIAAGLLAVCIVAAGIVTALVYALAT